MIGSSGGGGGRSGALPPQSPASWLRGTPGLKIVAPSPPADARGLLKAAIRDDNPVLFFEHKRLYAIKGPVNGDPVPIGLAAGVRTGSDVTIVTARKSGQDCLAAAKALEGYHVDTAVIDLRALCP